MKKVKVQDAVGMTLCHDITAKYDGFKGPLFRRGHVIREEDISRMLDIGKQTVFIWEPEAGEIHEEDAAILGIPGASIVMPTTMFDVVLPQIFAGIRFTREELIGLGNGGRCQQCRTCYFPNCTFGRY